MSSTCTPYSAGEDVHYKAGAAEGLGEAVQVDPSG